MQRRTFLTALAASPAFAQSSARWKISHRDTDTALPKGAVLHRFSVSGEDSVDFQAVWFSSDQCTLRVVDQERDSAVSLAEAMPRVGAIAGVNGGFFKPNFDPLGLVISQGRRAGTWQKSSLLGGVVMVKQGKPLLLWRDEFQDSARITELLQVGPRLVNHGVPVNGLENKAARPRTFIATDNAGQWLLGIGAYATLAHLAQILALPELVPGMEIVRALNFDGGKSTALWAHATDGSVVSETEFGKVRNFVAILPRIR